MREKPRKSHISIEKSAEPFAESSAELYKTKAQVRLDNRERTTNLVTKKFRSADGAKQAVRFYTKLREIGITLLPATYRLVTPDSNEVLMTDFEKNNRVAFSSNYDPRTEEKFSSSKDPQFPTSMNIDTFGDGLNKLKDAVFIASKNGVEIPDHAYFAIVPKTAEEDVPVSFVIADFDRIRLRSRTPLRELLLENMVGVRVFLMHCFFSNNPERSKPQNTGDLETVFDSWWENSRKELDELAPPND